MAEACATHYRPDHTPPSASTFKAGIPTPFDWASAWVRWPVPYVREHHSPRAVETPWQRRFVRRFG